jgi:hypothetical protein
METTQPKKNSYISKKERTRNKTNGTGKGLGKVVHSILGGSFLTGEHVINTLPFILYLAFLALMYITNSYYAQRNMIAVEKLKKELKELNYTYISTKSELMFISRQSEVSKKAGIIGLKESTVPAYHLGIVNGNKPVKSEKK